MPAYARVHFMRGRMLFETGAAARAARHRERAIALDPSLVEPRLDAALAAAMSGSHAVANAMLDELLDRRGASPDAWLTAARLALWSGDVERARALRTRLGRQHIERQERAVYVLDTAAGGDGYEATDYFAWLADADPAAARRSAAARKLEAELAVSRGDFARAIGAVDAAAASKGFFDLGWLDGCPLLEPLRASPRFVELRAAVSSTRRDVLEILDATREEP